MYIPKDSIFAPNSSFCSSLTQDKVESFDPTRRVPSPTPPPKGEADNIDDDDDDDMPNHHRAAARPGQLTTPDMKVRIAKLGVHGRRVMQYYAGNTTEAQMRTLQKLEEYQATHNRQPVAPLGQEGPRGGESQLAWECRICNEIFPTFQKVAVHLTSGEWCLPNWQCPYLLWYAFFLFFFGAGFARF